MEYFWMDSLRGVVAPFIAPQRCLICDAPSDSGFPLCTHCFESRLVSEVRKLANSFNSGQRCGKCGRPLVSSADFCYTCRTSSLLSSIDSIHPLLPYSVTGQELLISWKIHGMRGLSSAYARLVAEYLNDNAVLSHLPVIPVPPRPGKRAEKGWDQVEELACLLSRRYGVPVLDCLVRTSGLQQKKLGRAARFSNIHGHISVKPGMPVPVSAIVLDDLVTTGSTLDACSDALKGAGCEKVYGLTLFYD